MWTRIVRTFQAIGIGSTLWTFFTSPWFAAYLAAPALTAWALIAGIRENLPTPYVIAAGVFIFGAVNWGLNQLSLWIERNRVRAKLRFMGVTNSQAGEVNAAGVLSLSRMQYSVHLDNNAHFPIKFRIAKFRSTFDGRVHDGDGPRTEGTVMIGRPSQLGGTSIQINPPITMIVNDVKTGTIELEIEYWRWPWPKYRIRHNFKPKYAYFRVPPEFSWEYNDANIRPSD